MATLINMFITALSAVFLPVQEEISEVGPTLPHQVMVASLPATEGKNSLCCLSKKDNSVNSMILLVPKSWIVIAAQ